MMNSAEKFQKTAPIHVFNPAAMMDKPTRFLPGSLERRVYEITLRDCAEIEKFVLTNRIPALAHFTPLDNVPGILSQNLLSRDSLDGMGIGYIPTDSHRFDGLLNGISLSISFPNYKMFYPKRLSLDSVSGWAVLALKPKVLWSIPCLFLPLNAAKNGMMGEVRKNPSQFCGMHALKKLFVDYPGKSREALGLESFHTTNPQAEVIALEPIPREMIGRIYVEHQKDAMWLRDRIPTAPGQPSVFIDSGPFGPRRDYHAW